jgi:hypothetical protein
VNTLDILQNNIPCNNDPNGDEDNIHCKNTTMITTTTNRTLLASSSMECIYNETQLKWKISITPNNTPTKIEICSRYLPINASEPNPSYLNFQGILIIGKILDIYCNIIDMATDHCTIDSQSLSRFFIIEQSQVSFHNIFFLNGNGKKILSIPMVGHYI